MTSTAHDFAVHVASQTADLRGAAEAGALVEVFMRQNMDAIMDAIMAGEDIEAVIDEAIASLQRDALRCARAHS